MSAALLGSLALSLSPVFVNVTAVVSDDLSRVDIETVTELPWAAGARTVTVALSADRLREAPTLPTASEREVFVRRATRGGLFQVRIDVNGERCAADPVAAPAGGRRLRCPVRGAPTSVRVVTKAILQVPERFGPLGRVGTQLTLGGGWYPFVEGATGRHRARVEIPPGRGAVLGNRWWPAVSGNTRRTIEVVRPYARQIPLVVLPPGAVGRRAAGGRAIVISSRLDSPRADARRWARQVRRLAYEAAEHVARARGSTPPPRRPWLLVEAPLRHDLARAADGMVLLSDRAFRLTPLERLYRFHRYPILREVFRAWARGRTVLRPQPGRREDGLGEVAADAAAAFLLDQLIRRTAGEAEDAFDVLSFWSWIPAVDRFLYQPQLPFVGAYFARVDETDPLRIPIVAPERTEARGKRIFDKLMDRFGRERVGAVIAEVLNGEPLSDAVARAFGDRMAAEGFLTTWLGAYPPVRFHLDGFETVRRPGPEPSYETTVRIRRTAPAPAEPLTVLLGGAGKRRLVHTETSSHAQVTVTSTTAFAVERVVIDPFDRVPEAPSAEIPQPRFDNRSEADWRLLLNNFNLLLSPSAGTVDTAVDVGFSRVYDVFWRFGARAAYAPEAVTLSTRASRFFGARRTADRLSQWAGGALVGEYLRPDFTTESSGAYALTTSLFYGFDDRTTVWAPEPGIGLRAGVSYTRVLGTPEAETTADAVSLNLRALRSWRFEAANQVSLRANLAAFVMGTPREQLQFFLGGRNNVRGFPVDAETGRMRAILSAEWVHGLLANRSWNAAELAWVSGVDGAFFADVAWIGDAADRLGFRADVGYGLRVYLDYFGVRPGVMAVDVAIPLTDLTGAWAPGGVAVYIDFAQSFLVF